MGENSKQQHFIVKFTYILFVESSVSIASDFYKVNCMIHRHGLCPMYKVDPKKEYFFISYSVLAVKIKYNK